MSLEILDLDALEEGIYRCLCDAGGGGIGELAAQLDVSVAEVKQALHSLNKKGLVSQSPVGDLLAAPPDIAIEALLRDRQEELETARRALTELVDGYRRSASVRRPTEIVEVVVGLDTVAKRWGQLRRSASQEVLIFDKPPYVRRTPNESNTADTRHIEEAQLETGIRYRVIYDQSALDKSHLVHVTAMLAAGEEAKVRTDLPLKLAIVDRSTALIPLNVDAPHLGQGAALVHECSVLDALVALFEEYWHSSAPLPTSPGGDVDGADGFAPQDVEVLRLMACGLTDEAIGARLDVTARTIRRRIRSMMDKVNATSRFQLGWMARELRG